ncbi:hypothetical protein [Yersinia pekkanenii]|nr:hypothetical protein [Yersinia pekkanenii]
MKSVMESGHLDVASSADSCAASPALPMMPGADGAGGEVVSAGT